MTTLTTEYQRDDKLRILSLDGGGSKGFYTLGVLREIERMLNCPLYKRFNLIFGTSTRSIIAALLALGYEIDEIHSLYRQYVPEIMKCQWASSKSAALERLAKDVFGDRTFEDVKTGVGIVATRWKEERPMIFKASVAQAHGRKPTFVPGFGVTIGNAVRASCSAYPFFNRMTVTTSVGDVVEVMDGGFCANSPSLYALADAIAALETPRNLIRLISVGVGVYPEPKMSPFWRVAKQLKSVQLANKMFEINTQSMEQLRKILYNDIETVRINEKYERPEMACGFLEHDLTKLNLLRQEGSQSFANCEKDVRDCLFN